MTEITRSIEIDAPKEKVWEHLQPKNWTKTFSSVKKVEGLQNGEPGVGTTAEIVAGADDMSTIKYKVEITEYRNDAKIAYRRFGGPLAGKAVIQLRELQKGVLLTRSNYYDDDLSEETMDAISEGMESDNARIKQKVEAK